MYQEISILRLKDPKGATMQVNNVNQNIPKHVKGGLGFQQTCLVKRKEIEKEKQKQRYDTTSLYREQ